MQKLSKEMKRERMIKAARELKGMNQATASKRLGMCQSAYSNWEKHHVSNMIDQLKMFSSVTGVDIFELWGVE